MDIGGSTLPIINVIQNEPSQPNELNLNDVFEAISLADPTFGEEAPAAAVDTMASQVPATPYAALVEQPDPRAQRFRYKCEGRSAGSIPGANSTPENKTFPTLKIYNYTGPATIVVSCVTKDPPYRPHPHNLVGKERCDRGVCSMRVDVTADCSEFPFRNLGVQCVKRREIDNELNTRESIRVDPFRTGFDHRSNTQNLDLNAVRLAFQVFIADNTGRMRRQLPPVVSDVVHDKKSGGDLIIMRTSHCSGTVRGGTQMILLCEKVSKDDLSVAFYQKLDEQVIWEETVTPSSVHKQVAIVFETPPYRDPHTGEPVTVYIQLKRPSDDARSNSFPFEYIPEFQDASYILGKKRKTKMPIYDQERTFQEQIPIKVERENTSPRYVQSPYYVHQSYTNPNWMDPQMQGIPDQAGPSHMDINSPWSNLHYGQTLQTLPNTLSPMPNTMDRVSPMLGGPSISPMHGQALSPMHGQANSPMHGQALSPMHGQALSPMHGQALSPMHGDQSMSPMHVVQAASPMHDGQGSPMHGGQCVTMQNTYNQLPQTLDSNPTSFSGQFLEREPILDSGEFRSLLGGDGNALSSDLNKLNTSDLLL